MELEPGKEIILSLEQTPSLLYGNLSSQGDLMCLAHQFNPVLVRSLGPHAIQTRATNQITSITLAQCRGRSVLVVTTNTETQLWDSQREAYLGNIFHGAECETRGAGLIELQGRLFIGIGTGVGELLIAEIAADFSAAVIKKPKAHRGAVTCVAANASFPAVFITGDILGELQLWNSQLVPYASVPSPGDCVTGIAPMTPDPAAPDRNIAVSYGSGMIRIFAETGIIRCDIAAHSRWINAIAYDPSGSNRLASVSEDGLLCVWKMPSPNNLKVNLVGHAIAPHMLLTGVAFHLDGKSVCVAAYDEPKIRVYKLR